ncbi:MAG: hypothetical protein H6983_11515 [Ectothiorhodospiraceae bacterium]|nr:hypothetical protein [Ectothiorhodospiraceae bacterium]
MHRRRSGEATSRGAAALRRLVAHALLFVSIGLVHPALATSTYDWSAQPVTWPDADQLRVEPLAALPTAEGQIVLVTGDAGMLRSTDGGLSFTPSAAGLASAVSMAARSVSSPGTVYAASAASGVFSIPTALYRSDDAGAHWHRLGRFPSRNSVNALAVDPTDGNRIYAATGLGIAASADAGETWARLPGALANRTVRQVVAGTGVIYARTADRDGVWRSRDLGQTWTPASQGLADLNVVMLAVDASDGDFALAATPSGLHRTTDGGETWVAMVGPVTGSADLLAISSSASGRRLLAGRAGQGIHRSVDDGESWTALDDGSGTLEAVRLTTDPTDTDADIYIAQGFSARRLRVLRAGASTWADLGAGLGNHTVHGVVVGPPEPGYCFTDAPVHYLATDGGGVMKSCSGNGGWHRPSGDPLTGGIAQVAVHPKPIVVGGVVQPSALFAVRFFSVYTSVDFGRHWSQSNVTAPGCGALPPVWQLAADPVDPDRWYAGTTVGLFRSDNGGVSWRCDATGIGLADVKGLGVDPAVPGTVFAGGLDAIYRSTNHGATWSKVLDFAATGWFDWRNFAFDSSASPTTVYAGSAAGLARSDDAGLTWQTLPLPKAMRVAGLATDAARPGTVVVAGTTQGRVRVYESADRGTTWHDVTPPGVQTSAAGEAASWPAGVLALASSPGRPGATLMLGLDGLGLYRGERRSAVLLVDDDADAPDARAAYVAALDDLGVSHEVWDTLGSDVEPDVVTLARHDAVAWFTGNAAGPATGPGAAGEDALLDYGGCRFVSSQGYHAARGLTNFMNGILGADAVTENVGHTSVTGIGELDGLGPFALVYPAGYTNASDAVAPRFAFDTVLQGNAGSAAIARTVGSKRTFWTFPFEAISGAAARTSAMAAVLDYCGADPDGDGVYFDAARGGDAFPTDPNESADLDQDGVGDGADPDRDGDGMDDAYEAANTCLDGDRVDADVDTDGDGTDNVTELAYDSDPCDPASVPPDAFEDDDAPERAVPLPVNNVSGPVPGEVLTRDFHDPSDEDWGKFPVSAEYFYTVILNDVGGRAGIILEVDIDGDGIADDTAGPTSAFSNIAEIFVDGIDGEVLVRIRREDTAVAGLDAEYELSVESSPALPGFVRGHVRELGTGAPVVGAVLAAGAPPDQVYLVYSLPPDGRYTLNYREDSVADVGITASGFHAKQLAGVHFPVTGSTRDIFLVRPGADTDGDGLADDWEIEHFGTLAARATDDPDEDGSTNADEQGAGTDPTDPSSVPEPPPDPDPDPEPDPEPVPEPAPPRDDRETCVPVPLATGRVLMLCL